MQYCRLGGSGLTVSRLSFGTWVNVAEILDYNQSKDLIQTAYDSGINFFDTAEIYVNGAAEEILGSILKELSFSRDTYLISSKVFWKDNKNIPNTYGLSRKHIFDACHASLKRLDLEYIDIYLCHRPDPNTQIEETIIAMNDLIHQGKILYWGTSEWSSKNLLTTHLLCKEQGYIPPIIEQAQYNLLHRPRVELEYYPFYDVCNMGLITWSPLASGLLTGKYLTEFKNTHRLGREKYKWLRDEIDNKDHCYSEKITAFCGYANSFGFKPSQLAIAWCLLNKKVNSVILGATSKAQLIENISALDILNDITPEIETKLNSMFPWFSYSVHDKKS